MEYSQWNTMTLRLPGFPEKYKCSSSHTSVTFMATFEIGLVDFECCSLVGTWDLASLVLVPVPDVNQVKSHLFVQVTFQNIHKLL